MSGDTGLYFHWDPQNLEIRTKSVERTLEPLVSQVSVLVNFKAPSNRLKGRSRRAITLLQAIKNSTVHFLSQGEEIAGENPEIRAEIRAAIEDVRSTGNEMFNASDIFAVDPCMPEKRESMVRAGRALLSAVTRLLILADMVDVYMLLRSLRTVEGNVESIRVSNNQQDLLRQWHEYGENVMGLIDLAGMRQIDLIDPRRRDEIAAARATLKKNNLILLTASKACVRHPELAAAHANRDYAIKSVCDAVGLIQHGATQVGEEMDRIFHDAPGELAEAMAHFDNLLLLDPTTYDGKRVRPILEEHLENIITNSRLLANSPCTRPERRDQIFAECDNAKYALQNLLDEYARNAGRREPSDALREAMQQMLARTSDLRQHLAKSVIDHISDCFIDAGAPLHMLVDAAREGKEAQVESLSIVFNEHANKLIEVANLASSMTPNEEGAKLVRLATSQLDQLCPQVINAARVLCARPESKVAQENMDVFEDIWTLTVRTLTEAVDDITNIGDFLSVSERHILEDVELCIEAMRAGQAATVDQTAGVIRGRSGRLCEVVSAEMANFRSGEYVDRVMDAVVVLRDQIVPNFARQVTDVVNALGYDRSGARIDDPSFVSSAHRVYEGVRDVRRAVVFERDQDGYESEYAEPYEDRLKAGGRESFQDSDEDEVDEAYQEPVTTYYEPRLGAQENMVEEREEGGGRSERSLMRNLPPEQKQVLMQEMAGFFEEKKQFMREMAKWDDSANDMVVVAKRMCMIMMEMTDFTRGRGPLKTTMDVIQAARRISECGSQLDKLAKQISANCPDSASKSDLDAYLQRITLYCHQLNITSKVKADVQNVSGEIIVSGLDSATSLIQSAKNLMSAVVLTVKASYIASTKYKGTDSRPVIQWRMKAPGKKPLINREKYEDVKDQVRRSARYKADEPINELSQFDQPIGDSVA